MLPTVDPEAIGITIGNKMIEGKLVKSSFHKNFICTQFPSLKNVLKECVAKLNATSPQFNWRMPANVHGPHSTHIVDGEKVHVNMNNMREHGLEMKFKITGCGFRVRAL